MDALETLVRDTLVDRAADAPADDTLLDAVLQPRQRHWPVVGLAAAVVVAVAVTVVVIRAPWGTAPSGSTSAASPPVTTPPALASGIAAPLGYRWLTRSGVAITVPVGLPVVNGLCMTPAEFVLEPTARGMTIGCPNAGLPAKDQTLTIRIDSDSYGRAVLSPPTKPALTDAIRLHGLAGRIGYGTLHEYPGEAGRLVLPRRSVTITVTAPSRAIVNEVLLSARPASDLLGCATQLRPDRGPKRVPAHPLYGVACVYSMPQNGVDTRSLVAIRHLTGALLDRILQIDQGLVMRTGLTNANQRFVAVTLRYAAHRDVILGFLSGPAAAVITSR